MTREKLASLLENEAHNAAAERIRCGDDAVIVLRDIHDIKPCYNDNYSRHAIAIFQKIIDGEESVQ